MSVNPDLPRQHLTSDGDASIGQIDTERTVDGVPVLKYWQMAAPEQARVNGEALGLVGFGKVAIPQPPTKSKSKAQRRREERTAERQRLIDDMVFRKIRFSGDIMIGGPGERTVVHNLAHATMERRCADCGTTEGRWFDAALAPEAPYGRLRIDPTNGQRYSTSVEDYRITCRMCHRAELHPENVGHCRRGHAYVMRPDGSLTPCLLCRKISRIERQLRELGVLDDDAPQRPALLSAHYTRRRRASDAPRRHPIDPT